jgi:hypothetical protein
MALHESFSDMLITQFLAGKHTVKENRRDLNRT